MSIASVEEHWDASAFGRVARYMVVGSDQDTESALINVAGASRFSVSVKAPHGSARLLASYSGGATWFPLTGVGAVDVEGQPLPPLMKFSYEVNDNPNLPPPPSPHTWEAYLVVE